MLDILFDFPKTLKWRIRIRAISHLSAVEFDETLKLNPLSN